MLSFHFFKDSWQSNFNIFQNPSSNHSLLLLLNIFCLIKVSDHNKNMSEILFDKSLEMELILFILVIKQTFIIQIVFFNNTNITLCPEAIIAKNSLSILTCIYIKNLKSCVVQAYLTWVFVQTTLDNRFKHFNSSFTIHHALILFCCMINRFHLPPS